MVENPYFHTPDEGFGQLQPLFGKPFGKRLGFGFLASSYRV